MHNLPVVYTIGYSGFSVQEMQHRLREYGFKDGNGAVIDVRSTPWSARFSQYNKEVLPQVLAKHGIRYRSYALEFGARPDDEALYIDERADFELMAKSQPFLDGMAKLKKGMEMGYRFCLMCAEIQPIDCHRALLVSRAFRDTGHKIIHILPNGGCMTQEDLDEELLANHCPPAFPGFGKPAAFGKPVDPSWMLAFAYRKRNDDIGYRRPAKQDAGI